MSSKILLVEDHEDFRAVVRRYLETQDLPFEIFEAADGATAVFEARARHPDVVLMDIRLPDISGLDAANHIKSFLPESDIVILTMFETEAFRKVFHSDVIAEYLGKSELYDNLVPVLKKILAKKPASSKTPSNRLAQFVEEGISCPLPPRIKEHSKI